MTLTGVDKGGSRWVFTSPAVFGTDVGQLTLDHVDHHRAAVGVPGKPCSGLQGEPHHHGARRVFDVHDTGGLAIQFDLELEVDVVGEHGAPSQRGGDRKWWLLRRRRQHACADQENSNQGRSCQRSSSFPVHIRLLSRDRRAPSTDTSPPTIRSSTWPAYRRRRNGFKPRSPAITFVWLRSRSTVFHPVTGSNSPISVNPSGESAGARRARPTRGPHRLPRPDPDAALARAQSPRRSSPFSPARRGSAGSAADDLTAALNLAVQVLAWAQ